MILTSLFYLVGQRRKIWLHDCLLISAGAKLKFSPALAVPLAHPNLKLQMVEQQAEDFMCLVLGNVVKLIRV